MKLVRSAAAVLCLLAARVALADVTVVMKTTIDGMPRRPGAAGPAPKSRELTSTDYYKGDMVRSEMGDVVMIAVGDRVFLIDDASKTYQVATRKALEEQANPMAAMLQVQGPATLKPGGKTATILGKPAKNWLLTLSMRLNVPPGMRVMAEGATAATPTKPPVITMKMEVWTTEAVSVAKSRAPMSGGMGMLKPLTDKLQSIPGLTLRTTMTQTIEGMGMALKGMGKGGATVRAEAVSLSEKPLPDSLFAPPKGYKQRPFIPAGMPGMPGGPG